MWIISGLVSFLHAVEFVNKMISQMKYCAVSLFFLTIVGFSVNTNAANDAVKQRSDWYLGFAVGHGTVFDANYEQDGQKTKFEDEGYSVW